MNTSFINKEFRIVFQPKNPEDFNGKRRFAIGAGKLAEYLGEKNAETAIERALNTLDDKIRVKFRNTGWVDFYVK